MRRRDIIAGIAGIGMGVFKVTGATLVGADVSGGKYAGTVTEDPTGEITATFDMFVPKGIGLVQGASALDVNSSRKITISLPQNFGDGEPQKLWIPPGYVWVNVVRIPDEWAPYANGMTVSIAPSS